MLTRPRQPPSPSIYSDALRAVMAHSSTAPCALSAMVPPAEQILVDQSPLPILTRPPIERLEMVAPGPTISIDSDPQTPVSTLTSATPDRAFAAAAAANRLTPTPTPPIALSTATSSRAIRVRDEWPHVSGVSNVSELMRRHSCARAMRSVAESIDSLDSVDSLFDWLGPGTGTSSPGAGTSWTSLISPFARDDARRFSFDVVRARQLDRLEQQQRRRREQQQRMRQEHRLDDVDGDVEADQSDAGVASSAGTSATSPLSQMSSLSSPSSRPSTFSAAGPAPASASSNGSTGSAHFASLTTRF